MVRSTKAQATLGDLHRGTPWPWTALPLAMQKSCRWLRGDFNVAGLYGQVN